MTSRHIFTKQITYLFTLWIMVFYCPMVCTSSNRFYNKITKRPITHQQQIEATTQSATTALATASNTRDIIIGPCVWTIGRQCPDEDIKFYLYTRSNPKDRQNLQIGQSREDTNLTNSYFQPRLPTKIILHGYNADMFMHPLIQMKDEYLALGEYNVIYVDWSILAPGPCYVSAVHNTRHAGACVAQLVERLLENGNFDIHVIGFSLGAQMANFIAINLDSFQLPRITGLDPAMPLFVTASNDNKLDRSDAAYVDIIHSNALVQGKLEQCGHSDFYMNGGIRQPGCGGWNPSPCSHTRAPAYFMESIRSKKGFWGWGCSSYIAYLLGMCPPTNYLVEAGEHIKHSTKGMFLITTNDTSPFALGKWTDLPTLGVKRPALFKRPVGLSSHNDPLMKVVDQWGKLEYNFNDLEYLPNPYEQDHLIDEPNWMYYEVETEKTFTEVNNDLKEHSVEEQDIEESKQHEIKVKSSETIQQNAQKSSWKEYKRNMTEGYIDESIFQVPYLT